MRTIKEALGNHKVERIPKDMATWPCSRGLSYDHCRQDHDETCPGFTLDEVHWTSRRRAWYYMQEQLRA